MKHAGFHRGFIWVALTAALVAGFPLAAHLTFVIGFGFPIRLGYVSFVQIHGHVQLMGWAGLFIMGVSLHFIPRLAGVPIARPQWLRRMVWLMGIGLVLRILGHSLAPYTSSQSAYAVAACSLVLSGVLECGAVGSYVGTLWALLRQADGSGDRPALVAVRPYFGMMVCGWVLYASLNLVLLVHMVLARAVLLHPAWNVWGIRLFVGLVLIPVAFAFSMRLLPLYLRLPPIDWGARAVAYGYLTTLLVHLLAHLPPLLQQAPGPLSDASNIGLVLKGGVICWFVWKLDVLTRLRPPWTTLRPQHPGADRRPTRPGLPDYGEFGGFERLVYAAYFWLLLAAGCEAVSALSLLLGARAIVSSDAIMHMYLMGFISHLIFGLAVRMLPGFIHTRRIASPSLVTATFWLGNAAAVCRVLLFILPDGLLHFFPVVLAGVRITFALSGLLGLAAVLALAINLWKTSRGV